MKTVKQIVENAGTFEVTYVEDEAQANAAAIPNWATWDETQAQDYIDANVTTLASARTVLKAFARLLVALRDAQWPNLAE